ncbi:MAG: M23 family metallopeptidase [Patescibacteria group bacterium]
MDLLEGYHNINPTGVGGPELAIVDEMALAPLADDATIFFDAGISGTGQISVYAVRKGDTLSSIAKMFGVSSNTIAWANDIKNGKVSVGQELVILPITGVRHTISKGDTLRSIANKYKADLDEVIAYNNLDENEKIVPGEILIIPDGQVVGTQKALATKSASSNQVSVSSGYYLRPISGGRKSQGIHGYNGIDIAASVGTPIYASANGTVIVSKKSGYNGGYGTYVVVSHPNGTQTLYAHMSRNDVSIGQRVNQGDVIGTVGNTGRSTGPHIHFEVRGARNPF